MKWIDKLLDDKNESAIAFFWQLVGPLFILCTFALAPENYYIFFTGVVGLFLSAKFRNAGLIASFVILAGVSAAEHILSGSFQIWSLGLEVSYAMAFFITAQSAARHQTFVRSLFSQLDTRNALASNLEDELAKTRNEVSQQQMQLQEKVNGLQKQLDEVVSEQSSLQILNEVLRKTTANYMMKKDTLSEELYQLQSRLSEELSEKETLKAKISETNLSTHIQLLEELEATKREKEHTHTLKETLESLHTYEQQRAHAALEKLSLLEMEKEQLDQKIARLEEELVCLRIEKDQALVEKNRFHQKNEDELTVLRSHLEEVQLEKNTIIHAKDEQISKLHSQLVEAQAEKERVFNEKSKINEQEFIQICAKLDEVQSEKETLQKCVLELQQKMTDLSAQSEQLETLSKTELLYKQLRTQFEEKNAILHQTRSELFKIDNAYQSLQIELSQLDLGVPNDVVIGLQSEISTLQEENKDLLSIVTLLSQQEANVKKKSE